LRSSTWCVQHLNYKKAIVFDRNTYDYSCLAPYGGPVEPGVALGGFEGSDYSQATGLSISFMVSNHHNKTELLPAMEWELRSVHHEEHIACKVSTNFVRQRTKTKFRDIYISGLLTISAQLQ
jgi:hypothetical protein